MLVEILTENSGLQKHRPQILIEATAEELETKGNPLLVAIATIAVSARIFWSIFLTRNSSGFLKSSF